VSATGFLSTVLCSFTILSQVVHLRQIASLRLRTNRRGTTVALNYPTPV
jgi:hypothetical protein